jgi:predicted nucleotidyltransferase
MIRFERTNSKGAHSWNCAPLIQRLSTEQAADAAIVDFFSTQFEIDAVLLVNSCARGKATRDSCLDIIVLAQPDTLQARLAAWQNRWEQFERTNAAIEQLRQAGKYSAVHLDFIDGVFTPEERDEAAGPDGFELGRLLASGAWKPGSYGAFEVSGVAEHMRRNHQRT